jgi:hypothetical protein
MTRQGLGGAPTIQQKSIRNEQDIISYGTITAADTTKYSTKKSTAG